MDQSAPEAVPTSAERLLVLLTGPVGSGKSTVALALAGYLIGAGHSAAVIDLDVLYCMARQHPGFGEPKVWQTARRAAAALADTLFGSGLEIVIVEGGFFNHEECDGLRRHLASGARERFITLNVSYPEALRRAQSDPDPARVASRDPKVLRALYAEFVSAIPFLRASSVILEADFLTPSELVRLIADQVLGVRQR